jgi:predicted permease
LFVRTFAALIDRPLGFDADRVLVIQIDARQSTRPPQQRPALYQQMIEAVGAIPGVATASLSVMTPVSDNEWETVIENQPGSSLPEEERMVRQNLVGPDWFAVYGVPLLAGRGFEPADMAPDAPAVVISETFASRYFPGSNPVGHSIREVSSPDDPARPMTIVGIVKDSVYLSLREGPAPVIYRPITPAPQVSLSVRTTHASPVTLASAIVSAIGSLDRDLSLTVRPLATDIRSSINRERLLASLAGVFGTLAVLLAGIGLYGVASQAVAARRAEIGIRLALGATERAVVGLVTRNVALMFAAGVLLGMVLSGWAASFVGSLLYGVEPRDPATMIGAAVVLMTVGVAAGWAPARRASRIDPSEVLRRS